MNVLCPSCRSSIAIDENILRLICKTCGFETHLSQIGTIQGVATIPLLRDLAGETIDAYKLEALVGIGGMGIVYKAQRISDQTTVALKILNYDPLNKDEFVARFEREARMLRKLNHPHIVKVLDSGRSGDIYYIVTEFLKGRNLDRFAQKNRLETAHIIQIMTEVCSAIQYAHEQGIVHRDLKPANIFIIQDDTLNEADPAEPETLNVQTPQAPKRGCVKVIDFGLAQLTCGDSRYSSLTRTDLAMGTINYLSPEQRMNAKSVDGRSDIFSLGVIFYEMLTGQLPLGRFKLPSQLSINLNKIYDRIVAKSLDAIPAKRYQSVDELLKELKRLQKSGRLRKRLPVVLLFLSITFTAIFLVRPYLAYLSNIIHFNEKPVRRINRKPEIKSDPSQIKLPVNTPPVIETPDRLPHEMDVLHLTPSQSPKPVKKKVPPSSKKANQ